MQRGQNNGMKLLALGDIHLGRRPSRLPEELAGRATDFSPAKALQLTVDAAIGNDVDAVLFAGDVRRKRRRLFRGSTGASNQC